MADNKFEQCIICYYELGSVSNPLCKAEDIINSDCGCKFMVHKLCMEEWKDVKKDNFLCINCNTPATFKNDDFKDNDVINITPPQIELLVQPEPQESELCFGYYTFPCCFWTCIVFILFIIIIIG